MTGAAAVRVLVTRAAEGSERLARRLRAVGLVPVECPLVRTEPLGGDPVDASAYDWLVVTSRAAVHHGLPRLVGRLPRVAAVGPGTASALRARGIEPALVPAIRSQDGLVAELPRPPGRVLFAGATGARTRLADEFGADFLPVYRTVEVPAAAVPDADLAALASGSAARALARARTDIPCVSIGPSTTAAARAAGLRVIDEASSSDLDGLVAAVSRAAGRRWPRPGRAAVRHAGPNRRAPDAVDGEGRT